MLFNYYLVEDEYLGKHLLPDPRLQGVLFTGSTETARQIYRTLAASDGPIAPLIAETGGQNAMIVDSSALARTSCGGCDYFCIW